MPLCASVNLSSCGNSTPSTSRRRDVASVRRIAATLLAATVSIATLTHAAAAPCGEQVLAQSFDKYKGGYRAWTAEMAEADFDVGSTNRDSAAGESLEPGILSWSRGYENVQVGEGNMRVDFPEGCVGSSECGLLLTLRLPQPLEEATLSFRVRFSEGYDWTHGGKLPGVCGEECPTGCRASEGSFSQRVMWRQGGELEAYMYTPDRDEECGDSWQWDVTAGDTFREVRVYNKMNDAGKANGMQIAWVDGKEVSKRSDIVFTEDGKNAIEKLMLHNFHGGKSDKFAPGQDQSVWFDDFELREGECGPGAASSASFRSAADDIVSSFDSGPAAAAARFVEEYGKPPVSDYPSSESCDSALALGGLCVDGSERRACEPGLVCFRWASGRGKCEPPDWLEDADARDRVFQASAGCA